MKSTRVKLLEKRLEEINGVLHDAPIGAEGSPMDGAFTHTSDQRLSRERASIERQLERIEEQSLGGSDSAS